MREIITLQCGDCKNRNYTTTKNKKKNQDRLELKKFCPTCHHHTVHKEVKKAVGSRWANVHFPVPTACCLLLTGSRRGVRSTANLPVSKTGHGGSNPSAP